MLTVISPRRFAVLALCLLSAPLVAQKRPDKAPTKTSALAKLAEPWPDAEALKARRVEAEQRKLFASTDAVPLTLTADFKVINKDRSAEGKKDYPAVLTVTGEGGATQTLHVKLRTRGHFRLRATSCSFVPLRVEFDKDEVKGTVFDRQKILKLITHCQSDKEYEQYILREYLVYRVHNLLTPRSFRGRLAKATYVQASDGKPVITRLGLFLEDDDDVARRMEGRVAVLPRALFKDIDPESLTLSMVFEYLIGNTDYSIYALHNVRLVKTPANTIYAVPYDFDMTGLVNARYALADRVFNLKSVRDRLYRGPCRTAEELEPVLNQFRAHKAAILALYDSLPELDPQQRREAKEYIDEFYRTIDRKGDVNRTFIDGQCSKKSTM
jgi:hypothetical protein